MTIREMQEMVDNWIQTIGVRYFNEMTNTLVLQEEVGEFSRLVARIYGEQSFKESVSEEEQAQKLKDELADVLFVIICLANQMNIDLTEAMKSNLEKKTTRDHDRHRKNRKL